MSDDLPTDTGEDPATDDAAVETADLDDDQPEGAIPTPPSTDMGRMVFEAATTLVTLFVVQRVMRMAWKRASGRQPPSNPASAPSTTQAILWAPASAGVAAVARAYVQRKAAVVWHSSKQKDLSA